MSRINDALKRAQRAHQKHAPPAATKVSELPPVQSKPGNAIGWMILPGVIGFLIVVACLFTGLTLGTRTMTKTSGESRLLAAQQTNPVAIATPIPATNTPPPPPPLQSAPPPPSPPPPEPKLQGIVYATTQPWAIVDGKNVHVGDRLGEFRVKEISQRSVTLEEADGSQKRLGLAK